MEIKRFKGLVRCTRDLNAHLARSLSSCATGNNEEKRTQAILDYLASHEARIERIVTEVERKDDTSALEMRVYDHLSRCPIQTHRTCDEPYIKLGFSGIRREIFDFHDQVIDLYRILVEKAETPMVKELMESLLTMELNKSSYLSRQIGRMDDL
jgi:hypothetical protein